MEWGEMVFVWGGMEWCGLSEVELSGGGVEWS